VDWRQDEPLCGKAAYLCVAPSTDEANVANRKNVTGFVATYLYNVSSTTAT
jgi:hypothetical protein